MAMPIARSFENPVSQAQAAFRVAMNALATPGRGIPYRAPLEATPLPANAAALLLALLDFEVTFHLAPSLSATPDIGEYLAFHTGARQVNAPNAANFAVLDLARDAVALAEFAQGTPEYPDRSTTIIAIAEAFSSPAPFRISGPGIKGEGTLAVAPLPADFAGQWALNRKGFPLGVDVLFTTAEGVVGLPRSSRILEEAR